MKKISAFFTLVLAFVMVFVLASCGASSKVDVDYTVKATTTQVTFNLTFGENDNLTSKTAVPHIKKYAYDESAEDNVGDYKNEDLTATFENGVYTSSKVTFKSLTPNTDYMFRIYITFNANEELKATVHVKTASSDKDNPTKIESTDDFLAMGDNPEGFYILEKDLDFNGEAISAIFSSSSSKMFTGTFDGNNKTISNFTLSSSNTGLFNYCSKATIKNLTVAGNTDRTTADYSSGRSTANVGILAGQAESTVFENVTVKNSTIVVKGNSSAQINLGGFVGSADKCSFKNCHVEDVTIEYTQLRLKVATGLFAGVILGDGVEKDNDVAYAAINCSAKGSIKGVLYYPSSEGYTYVGGFVGDLGSSSVIKDSYIDGTITLYKDETNANSNKCKLSVGGFAGTNQSGSMNIAGCVAAADITVNATAETTQLLPAETVLTAYYAEIGGFIGTVNKYIAGVKDSAYVKKSTGVTVNAKAKDDDNKDLFKSSNTIGAAYDGVPTENFAGVDFSSFDASKLSATVKAVFDEYNK